MAEKAAIGGRSPVALMVAALGLAAMAGCGEAPNRFEIVNYRQVGERERFYQDFDECYYAIGQEGTVDMVARRHSRGAAGEEDVTQIIHVRTIFRAVPGETYVESSMINGVVTYAIIGESGGACYEGGGFLSCAKDSLTGKLTGELEQSRLSLTRETGAAAEIFQRAEVTGKYEATSDRRKVVRILNELERLFGPRPRYEPSPGEKDVL